MITLEETHKTAWETDTSPELLKLDSGSQFGTARCVGSVTNAWELVYDVYRHQGLVGHNPYSLHTTPQAAAPLTAVFEGRRGPAVESTLTAVVDGPNGLPLDSTFAPQLQALRGDARRLMECCMFAHRQQIEPGARKRRGRPATPNHAAPRIGVALVNLMRLAFWYGMHSSVSDFVLSVPTQHARFFARAFGFERLGPQRPDTTLNHQPMVLLHADLMTNLKRRPLPFALRYSLERPIEPQAFDRVKLRPYTLSALAGRIDGYLKLRSQACEAAA